MRSACEGRKLVSHSRGTAKPRGDHDFQQEAWGRAVARRRGRRDGGGVAHAGGGRRAAPAAPTVSGGTIKVGGIGYVANYGDAAIGAQARFQRANDDKEVKGYKFQWTEFADDKNDPATALSETRRLVTQDGIFALVDVSLATPGDYLTQQQVPWFGPGYDATYCPDPGREGLGLRRLRVHPPRQSEAPPTATSFALLKKELASKGVTNPTHRSHRHRRAVRARRHHAERLGSTGLGLQRGVRQGHDPGAARGGRRLLAVHPGDAHVEQRQGTRRHLLAGAADASPCRSSTGSRRRASPARSCRRTTRRSCSRRSPARTCSCSSRATRRQSKGIDQFKADVEAFKPGTTRFADSGRWLLRRRHVHPGGEGWR